MPNPSDIAVILNRTQDILDEAVKTVTATTKTQEVFEQNILLTDKKISVHNKHEEAHDGVLMKVKDMPAMLVAPEIEGPDVIETGEENTWTFTSNGMISSVSVTHYDVTDAEGNTFRVEAGANNVGVFTHTFTGPRESDTFFDVIARNGETLQSPATKKSLHITQHLPPDMSNMTVTLPDRLSYNKSYPFTISGITDLDEDITELEISISPEVGTFSKTTGIRQDEEITFTMGDTQGGEATITIIAKDGYNLSSAATITRKINTAPDVSGFAHTLPNHLTIGKSIPCKVSGVTDIDEDEITFDITSSLPAITFSKSKGIALNESFNVIIASSAVADTAYTLTLTFKDPYGGETTKTISSTINTPPDMSKFTCTKDALYKPNSTNEISFSGATDANGEALTYSITNTNAVLSFSKIDNIEAGEKITMTVAASAVRGTSYSIDVTVTDASGASSTVTVQFKINQVITTVGHNIASVIKPATDYVWKITNATDADNQTLSYTITSDNANVTITGGTNIAANTNFTVNAKIGTGLARGDIFNLLIAANDGMETSTIKIPVKINQLGVVTNVTGIPTSMSGGNENKNTAVKITGGSDPEAGAFTYSLININANLTFSKTTGITNGEAITLTCKKVSAVTNATVDVVIIDSFGEQSEAKRFTVAIQPIIGTKAPTITYPTTTSPLTEVPHYTGFTMTWSAYAEEVDTDMDHTIAQRPWN